MISVIFTVSYLAAVTGVAFFTIFNLRLSDYLQLVPGHTDCLAFAAITGVASKFIAVASFNYMVILDEVRQEVVASPFRTGFADLYHPMLNVPFFGTEYNTILPCFIVIFGLLFAVLQVFRIDNKAMATLKRIGGGDKNQRNSLEDGEDSEDDEDIEGRGLSPAQKRQRSLQAPDLSEKDYGIIE